MSHPHFSTGLPCDCTFTRHLEPGKMTAVAQRKTADKLHDFLMSPKSRPDLQTPEGQRWLKMLQHNHERIGDKFDPLTPWLTREWKKGRIRHSEDGEFGHPYFMHLHPDEPDPNASAHYRVPLTQQTLAHWSDFLQSDHPLRRDLGDIMDHHVQPFHDRIEAWTAAMQEAAEHADRERLRAEGDTVHTTPDGWTVRQLTEPHELEHEGEVMGHCVGGYHPQVESGETLIYSLRDPKGEPHSTIEITPTRHYSSGAGLPENGRVVQIQGKSDSVPIPKYQERLKDWFTSFPEEDRPEWELPSYRPIKHIGQLMPEAETWDSHHGVARRGDPDADDQGGGYGPHGDYGLKVPHRDIDYLATIDSLARPREYSHYHNGDRPTDPSEIKALYDEAVRRNEIPEFGDAAEAYRDHAEQDYMDFEDQNLQHIPAYPGGSWDEEPERWQEKVNQALNGELEWGDAFRDVETPEEAFDVAKEQYDGTRDELRGMHEPTQLSNSLYQHLAPHYREGEGYVNIEQPQVTTFSKVASAQIPPKPGTTPIPPGNVRLYHYTGATPEQIAQEGLSMQYAKGQEYGEPNQIWASGRPPSFDNHNVVEFHVPRDDPRWDIGKYEPWINYGGGAGDPNFDFGQYIHDRNAHVTFRDDIRPDEVLAVHEPWHQHYRYLMENYPTPDSASPNEFDWALDPDASGGPDLSRAVQEWKNSLWGQQGTVSKLASQLYQRFVYSPSSGEVTLSDNGDEHPRYHSDLASQLNEPGLVHGYAYRIGGGWRLMDWANKPLEDHHVIAQVMRALQGAEADSGPQGGSWERLGGTDWSRCHHGLPT